MRSNLFHCRPELFSITTVLDVTANPNTESCCGWRTRVVPISQHTYSRSRYENRDNVHEDPQQRVIYMWPTTMGHLPLYWHNGGLESMRQAERHDVLLQLILHISYGVYIISNSNICYVTILPRDSWRVIKLLYLTHLWKIMNMLVTAISGTVSVTPNFSPFAMTQMIYSHVSKKEFRPLQALYLCKVQQWIT